MNFDRIDAIARIVLAAVMLSFQSLAIADTCTSSSSGLCSRNGASCGLIHDGSGNSKEVCRWSSASNAAACGGTPGIWTTADSKYGQNHPDAVVAGNAGACISEVGNILKLMTETVAATGQFHVIEENLISSVPIELEVSDLSSPPLPRQGYEVLGYWDVDDRSGNESTNKFADSFSKLAFGSVRDMMGTLNHKISSRGTHEFSKKSDINDAFGVSTVTVGGYFASLSVDRQNLHKISDLRITASDDPPFEIANRYLELNLGNVKKNLAEKKILMEPNPPQGSTKYVVGIWDVDGGGGYGNDGSFGTYGMTMYASLGAGGSDRQLLDLRLVASGKAGPTIQNGYDIVGYWDVDKGGSRGSDGSVGGYMMTLLAKWSK